MKLFSCLRLKRFEHFSSSMTGHFLSIRDTKCLTTKSVGFPGSPRGAFYLAKFDGLSVGAKGLRALAPNVAEFK